MATLEQLRQTFGGDSDADTLKRAADRLGMSIYDIADEVGVSTGRNQGAFTAGLSSGVDDLQGLGYSAMGAVADTVGKAGLSRAYQVRDWANRNADRNQAESQLAGRPDLEQIEDVYGQPGKWLPYAAYQVGKQGPNIVGGIAAGALVPEVAVPAGLARAAAVLPRALGGGGMASRVAAAAEAGGSQFAARRAALDAGQTFGRQIVGGGAYNYGQSVGSLYQASVDGGNPDAGVASLAGGVPYALAETLPEAMLVGRFAHGGGFEGNLLSRMGKAGGIQAASGATSELAQNEMEMAYQGNVTPQQAFSKRLNSGVAGAVVEGLMGGLGGIRRGRAPVRTVDEGSTDLTHRPLGLAEYEPTEGPAPRDFDAPNWDTAPGAADPRTGLPFEGTYGTGNLTLRAPTEAGTQDMFAGEPTLPTAPTQGRPEFELTAPDPRAAAQLDLPLAPGAQQPTAPITPSGAQRGVPGQLPFSANTQSPKGQVLQGLVESLAAEGHLAQGADVQASTLIAQGKFAAAKKIVDEAMKNKSAADDMVFKAREAELANASTEHRAAEADSVFEQAREAKAAMAKLLDKNGRIPRDGTKRRAQYDAAATLHTELVQKWADLTRKPKAEVPDASTGTTAGQRPGNAAAIAGVQRGGGERNDGGVQPAAVAAPAPAAARVEDAPAVPADPVSADALEEADDPAHVVTSEALVQTADGAKDLHEYESALDELYRRWRDDGDRVAADFFESNARVPGFSADMARLRERAGETSAAPSKVEPLKKVAQIAEGKRGLKVGKDTAGTQSQVSKDTDDVLRGLAMPRFSIASEGELPLAPEKQIPQERLEALAAEVDIPGAPRFVVADSPADIPGIGQPPAGVHPMGVLAKGKVFLFRNAITSELEAIRTVFHELFHYGLRRFMPADQYYATMAKIARRDAKVREYADTWKSSEEGVARQSELAPETYEALAVEEALARIAEEIKTGSKVGTALNGTVRNIAAWLADVAQGLGMKRMAQLIRRMTYTEAERFVADALAASSSDFTPVKGSVADIKASRGIVDDEPSKFRSNKQADNTLAGSFAKVPFAHTTLGQKIQDALFNLAESPWALKWTTNDQIAEAYKHLKPVQDINRATSRMASVANRYLEVAAQTAKKWRALDDDVQLAMQKVMLKSTLAEAHVAIKGEDGKYLTADEAWKHADNNHLDKTPEGRGTFGALYQEFHGLPAAAKAVYETVRDDMRRQHDDTLRALRKSVADQYAGQLSRALTDAELQTLATSDKNTRELFAEVLGETGSKSELRALSGLYNAMRDINANFGTIRGPYFPLVRFGDHVVVMKAKALVDLELSAAALRTELQAAMDVNPNEEHAEGHDAKLADLRARYQEALSAVEAAKQDDKKYVVEFHESPAQAERSVQALRAKNPEADVYRSVREQYYRGLDGASGPFIKDLQETLAAALDSGDGVTADAKSTVLQSVKDLYMRRQPERSALRAELRRMGIEGVQAGQMLRGYAQAARNGAWRISRLTHAGDVTSGLQALSQDRRSADAKHVLNELKARFVGDLAPPENNKVLQGLSQATYFMHLGFNISYFATNATQAWLISLPVMSGRHGVVNAANSLTAASKDVIKLLASATAESVKRDGKLVGLQLRLTDEQIGSLARDPGEAAMLKALTDDGVVDITIKHDLGAISDGTSDSIPGKVLELSSALANYPELYNRLSTALAAYRMEMARGEYASLPIAQRQEKAEAYAEHVINRTHFNYSPENAPRMMRGQLGRLLFQFKRYQQGMIYLFSSLVKKSMAGDTEAMKSLAYLLGATTTVGGVVSLPIAAPIALAAKVLAAAYPDDDEPEWMQQWYNGMKDVLGETTAQMLVKGAPTALGLDLSKKLGQGDILNPVAFANTDGKKVFSRDYMTEVGFSLLGPGAALIGNEAEAVGLAKNGEILKAAEKGLPTFIANAVKAFRRAEDGLATKSGDTILAPEEFSALSTAAKAIGFESVKVSDTYDNRSAYMQMLQNRTQARQGLLRQYYEAIKSGDGDSVAAAREAIDGFNTRQQADRIKGTDLAASLKAHTKRTAETHDGLRVGKRDQDTYRRVLGNE